MGRSLARTIVTCLYRGVSVVFRPAGDSIFEPHQAIDSFGPTKVHRALGKRGFIAETLTGIHGFAAVVAGLAPTTVCPTPSLIRAQTSVPCTCRSTRELRDATGEEQVTNTIVAGMATLNQAMANSGVNLNFDLVRVDEVSPELSPRAAQQRSCSLELYNRRASRSRRYTKTRPGTFWVLCVEEWGGAIDRGG